jgi:hypothetical protein
MKWPFKLTLKGMLLDGKDRERAQAKYELTGKDLEQKLLDLDFDNKDSIEYKKALLELQLKYADISKIAYSKQIASLNNEPWVAYKDYNLEEVEGRTGFWFELDWNDIFIEKLKSEGYEGVNDEHIVRRWYAELCRVVALEEGLALDLFGDALDDEVNSKGVRRRDLDDNFSEYS